MCPFSVRFWILGGVNAVVDMVGGFVGGERGGRGERGEPMRKGEGSEWARPYLP